MAKTLEEIILTLIEPTGFCWLWKGKVTDKGYGTQHFESRTWGAHRLVYTALVGEIPKGLQLDHLCRVPNCVNPDHLEPVTPAENNRRRKPLESWKNHSKQSTLKTKTHCRNGHDLAMVGLREITRPRNNYFVCNMCKAIAGCKSRHRSVGCPPTCKIQAYPVDTAAHRLYL